MKVWMLTMPGLTGDILLREAEALGMPAMWQMVNFTKGQWDTLRKSCERALNLPENWEELGLQEALRLAKEDGWSVDYGPTGQSTYKRKPKVKPEEEQAALW